MFQRYPTAGGLIAWVHSLCEEFNTLELCLPDASPCKPAFSCTLLPHPSLLLAPAGHSTRSCLIQSCSYFSKDKKWFFFTYLAVQLNRKPGRAWSYCSFHLPSASHLLSPCSISCQWGFQCLMQRLLGHFSLCTAVPLWYKQPWTLPKCYWTDATLCYISLTELHKWGCMLSRVDSNQEVDSSSGLHVKDTETSCPWCIGVCEWILGLKQRKITCFTLWKTKCSIILVIQHKIRIIALLTKKGSEMYCRKYVVHRVKW